jgi:cytochrome c oxidase cbb3-type subunit 1
LILLPRYARRFDWPLEARRWLLVAAGWGAVLLPTAVVTFLPRPLRASKFTDLLVAHAHLAMAGLCSSVAALLLVSFARPPLRRALARPLAFWAWQGGCAAMVVALALAGIAEVADPGLPWHPEGSTLAVAYTARWLAGAAMFVASLSWLRGSLGALATGATP